jgi:hypothetical protein
MELLFTIPIVAFVTVLVAFKAWLYASDKQRLSKVDLFNRRVAAYEQLKTAVAPLRRKSAVSPNDAATSPKR